MDIKEFKERLERLGVDYETFEEEWERQNTEAIERHVEAMPNFETVLWSGLNFSKTRLGHNFWSAVAREDIPTLKKALDAIILDNVGKHGTPVFTISETSEPTCHCDSHHLTTIGHETGCQWKAGRA